LNKEILILKLGKHGWNTDTIRPFIKS